MRSDINPHYARLVHFVSKNTVIPAGIKRVTSELTILLDQFKEKINDNSLLPTDDIFSHPDVELMVLALLKDGLIKNIRGQVLLEYIQMLRQYTAQQELKAEDELNFKKTNVVFSAGIATESSLTFITKSLSYQFKKIAIQIDHRKIKNIYNRLQGCEKWIFEISHAQADQNNLILLKELQYFPWAVSKNNFSDIYYFSPAFNLALLQKIWPNCPVQIQPIFGSIKETTLTQTIASGYRPITLYSPNVSSNPKKQHKSSYGPMLFTLHDWYHIASMHFLLREKDAFELIFHTLVPALYKILPKASADEITNYIGDLNIVASGSYHNAFFLENALEQYVIDSLSKKMPLTKTLTSFFKLYQYFSPMQREYAALNGRSIIDLLKNTFIAARFTTNFHLGNAVMQLFTEKFNEMLSTKKNENKLAQDPSGINHFMKMAQIDPIFDEARYQSLFNQLKNSVMFNKLLHGSFFATEKNPYGPFADRYQCHPTLITSPS